MVIMIKPNSPIEKINHLIFWLEDKGFEVRKYAGELQLVLGIIGNTAILDIEMLRSLDIVESASQMSDPFKAANRKMHPDDSIINIGKNGLKIGGGHFDIMAGPCSVEGREQIINLAKEIKAAGAGILRGGAFKPRTSPYDFQGMKDEGLELLKEARKITGLPIVTELMDAKQIHLFEDIDVIQVGARNTQNYDLLKEIGKTNIPVLLKRGLAGTVKELLMSAEYIMAGGNENVILCERGIRTYETGYTRNTLDLSVVPVLKKLTHLPVVVDPSHGTGKAYLVPSMSLAAAAAGADGLMIEVHNDPKNALSDGEQCLTPSEFHTLADQIFKIREVLNQ